MSDALEQAALAFDSEMGVRPAPTVPARSERSAAPTETLFDVEHEDDEEAGGDNLPPPIGAVQEEPKPPVEDEEDEQDQDSGADGSEDDEDEDLSEEERAALKEQQDEDDPLSKAKYMVTVNGEEVEVSLREALNGYSRTAAFHQGMNQLSEWRGQLETEMQAVAQDRVKLIESLNEAEALLAGILPPEPDWNAEFAKDPAAARQLQQQYETLYGQINTIRGKRFNASQEQERIDRENMDRYAQREMEKFARIAKWDSQETMQKDLVSMKRTALTAGFSEKEVATVYDSRMLEILRKASKYDRMMAARPRPVQKGPNKGNGSGTVRGSGRSVPKISKPQEKLRRTGRIDDAIPVFQDILNPKRR